MMSKDAAAGFPFAGNVLESLELMRKAWAGAGISLPGMPSPAGLAQAIPSMMMPTLDVAELDKRIADLRAVEQWLALNANMLRATIQTLEVQRNTIATLKTLGAGMFAPPAGAPAAATTPAPAAPSFFQPAPPPAARAPAAQQASSQPPAPRRARRPASRQPKAPEPSEAPLNPAAWWSTLQDQFTRIATAAAGQSPAPGGEPAADKPRRGGRTSKAD
jgi:hypothetical protein